MSSLVICEVCGNELPSYYKFCPNCGTPLGAVRDSRRISTGNPDLDHVLEGGFEKGKTYLVAGETGSGKTIFSLQYLLHGIKNGDPSIYVTIDERPEVLVRDARRFGWDLVTPQQEGKLIILPVRQYFTQKMWGKDMDTVVTNIVNELSKAAKAIGARRLAIDPVAPLVTTSTSEIAWVREYIRSLIFNIEDKIGTTTLITSEIPTGDDSLSRYGVEEFLASGIIVLGLVREGGKITRTLFIRKMRWTAVDPTIYTFVIQRGKGINITGVLS